jgi:hypothetical protein
MSRKEELLVFLDENLIDFETLFKANITIISCARGLTIVENGMSMERLFFMPKHEVIQSIRDNFNSDLCGYVGTDPTLFRIEETFIVGWGFNGAKILSADF